MFPFETKPEKLRPFGIRNLNGTDERHGILHISSPQYDSTLKSHPDAVLTYVDEDDGETITVGSGLELEQRLEEPAARAAARVSSFRHSCACAQFDDQEVHLFNIKHTPKNVTVWKEHECCSSKSQGRRTDCSSRLSTAFGVRTTNFVPDEENHLELSSAVMHPELPLRKLLNPDFSKSTPRHEEESIEKSKTPITSSAIPAEYEARFTHGLEAMEKPLGMFADLLDSTAEILCKTAQKTRKADSSPIETFLGGMKNIITEVGQLGLEVLQAIEEDLIKTKQNDNTARSDRPPQTLERNSVTSQKPPFVQNRVSFATLNSEKSTMIDSQTEQEKIDSNPVQQEKLLKLFDPVYGHPSANNSSVTHILSSIQSLTCTPAPGQYDPLPKDISWASSTNEDLPQPVLPSNASSHQVPKPQQSFMEEAEELKIQESSIMDNDHANSEFLEKYPPLPSLRRAKTMESLNHPPKRSDWLCHKAALTRYPSISQLQSRDMTKAEEPAPYLAWKPPIIPASKVRKITSPKLWTDCESGPITQGVGQIDDSVSEEQARKDLPGAWPELKSEEAGILPVVNHPAQPDYIYMCQDGVVRARPPRPVSPALSCRNTSPPKDSFFPASFVRRANTVTASNPAARLSTPFDPITFNPSKGQAASISREGLPSSKRPALDTGPKRSQSLRNASRYEPSPRTLINEPTTSWTGFPASRPVPQVNAEATSSTSKGPQTRQAPSQTGAWPYPPVPKPSSQHPANRFPRSMRSEPNFAYPKPTPHRRGRGGQFPPPPSSTSKVDECVNSLRQMGYGKSNPNEAVRLNVYASAAAGDVIEAIEMIEDDRKAAEAMKLGTVRTL